MIPSTDLRALQSIIDAHHVDNTVQRAGHRTDCGGCMRWAHTSALTFQVADIAAASINHCDGTKIPTQLFISVLGTNPGLQFLKETLSTMVTQTPPRPRVYNPLRRMSA